MRRDKKTIYIRHLHYEEAKEKFLNELDECFCQGITRVNVVHGVGEYILRKMVLKELENINYAEADFFFDDNPGELNISLSTYKNN